MGRAPCLTRSELTRPPIFVRRPAPAGRRLRKRFSFSFVGADLTNNHGRKELSGLFLSPGSAGRLRTNFRFHFSGAGFAGCLTSFPLLAFWSFPTGCCPVEKPDALPFPSAHCTIPLDQDAYCPGTIFFNSFVEKDTDKQLPAPPGRQNKSPGRSCGENTTDGSGDNFSRKQGKTRAGFQQIRRFC